MLSKAAVMHDAKAIRKRITCLKQEVCAAANAAETAGRMRKLALPPGHSNLDEGALGPLKLCVDRTGVPLRAVRVVARE